MTHPKRAVPALALGLCLGAAPPLAAQTRAKPARPAAKPAAAPKKAGTAKPAAAKKPPPPAATPPEDDLAVEYDVSFQDFMDSPFSRLKNPQTLPPPEPLLRPYDPLVGLLPRIATSRVMNTNRALFSLPVLSAKVGDEVKVPVYADQITAITGFALTVAFDPKVLQLTGVDKTDWQGATLNINDTPEPDVRPSRKVGILAYAVERFRNKGTLFQMRFRAVGPGASLLSWEAGDAADDQYELIRTVVRDGLVKVEER